MMQFRGQVVQGVNVGSKFGVATANLLLENLPEIEEGVYFVNISWPLGSPSVLEGLFHFGPRKTFGSDLSAEVHILDFNQNIYGQPLEIKIRKFHRSVQKFLNADQLFTQIEKDIIQAQKYFCRQCIGEIWSEQSLASKQSMAEQAVEHLSTLSTFLEAKDVIVYAPQMSDEIHFVPKLMQIFPQKNYWFPRVENEKMEFYQVEHYEDLKPGAFGILEPEKGDEKLEAKTFNSGLILVPAVASDESGQRLGKGGGYYDRFLETLPKEVKRVSVIPDFALKKNLPIESHDQLVDKVLVCTRQKV